MNDINRIGKLADEYFAREDVREQAIKDLAEIVAVPSVAGAPCGKYPFGSECARALDKAAGMAQKYGFRVENHAYRCLSVLWGESETETGIVCHLDVVPAGDGWSGDPFVLRRENGLLMGRGAHDDKGPFIQALYTLRFFKECGIKLPFTLRLILGSDEEVGSTDLGYFVSVRKPPAFSFTPDSEFPVCIGEKGILGVKIDMGELPRGIKEISGGTVTNAVPGRAYALLEKAPQAPAGTGVSVSACGGLYKAEAEGKAAHAAMPEAGVNAISLLCAYLLDSGLIPEADAARFNFLREATGEYLGEKLGIAGKNGDFGYLTCVGGVVRTENGRIMQSFNIRYLPGTPREELTENISRAVSPYGGRVVGSEGSEGYFVSADDPRISALTRACESVLGIECKPYTMGGGTYARMLPNTVAFGSGILSQRRFLGDERGNAHQRDEYISESELFDGMRIYSRALGNLSEIAP